MGNGSDFRVDASVTLAWALPDESSPYADAVLALAEQEGLRVPDLWAREIANGLAVAYLRKRITSTARHPRAARRGLTFLARRGAGLVSRSALSGSLMKFSGCSRLATEMSSSTAPQ